MVGALMTGADRTVDGQRRLSERQRTALAFARRELAPGGNRLTAPICRGRTYAVLCLALLGVAAFFAICFGFFRSKLAGR